MHGAIGTGYRAAAAVLRLTTRARLAPADDDRRAWSRQSHPCSATAPTPVAFSPAELAGYAGRSDVIVLALPRGGVPVAYEVARALGAPLDVFLVRKLGLPGHEELAMGAIASGGIRLINDDVVERLPRDRRGDRDGRGRGTGGAGAPRAHVSRQADHFHHFEDHTVDSRG